jgi:hypothetical protein
MGASNVHGNPASHFYSPRSNITHKGYKSRVAGEDKSHPTSDKPIGGTVRKTLYSLSPFKFNSLENSEEPVESNRAEGTKQTRGASILAFTDLTRRC